MALKLHSPDVVSPWAGVGLPSCRQLSGGRKNRGNPAVEVETALASKRYGSGLPGVSTRFLLLAASAVLVLLQNERARATQADQFNSSQGSLVIQLPNGATTQVGLAGVSAVQVNVLANGATSLTNGSGLDEVTTQMPQLNLTGTNAVLGPVTMTLDPKQPTLGKITENINNAPGVLDLPPFAASGSATSFFDVFADITIGSQTYHTPGPLNMQALVTHEPPAPGESFVNPVTTPVQLLDANGNPTGVFLLREVYTPNALLVPEPSVLLLVVVGCGLIGGRRRRDSE